MEQNIIKAKFIESEQKGICLPAAVQKLNDYQNQLSVQGTETRKKLATKLKKLRTKIKEQTNYRLAQQQKSILESKLQELDHSAQKILKNCYREALQTIKSVCLATFNCMPEGCEELLKSNLEQTLKKLDHQRIIQLEIPAGLTSQLKAMNIRILAHDSEKNSNIAKVVCTTGNIIIDPIRSLEDSFDQMQIQLEQKL